LHRALDGGKAQRIPSACSHILFGCAVSAGRNIGSISQVRVLYRVMAGAIRRPRVKQVPLSEVKDDLSRFLREAENEGIVITRHGKPAGVLIGFGSEDDWFDYRLENDPRFLARIERARASLRTGRGVKLEDLPPE
jgi:prevent-host-death family protein